MMSQALYRLRAASRTGSQQSAVVFDASFAPMPYPEYAVDYFHDLLVNLGGFCKCRSASSLPSNEP